MIDGKYHGIVYKITNPSGKVYIGQTINFKKRMTIYRNVLCVDQIKLFNSLKKYGFDNHNVEILEEILFENDKTELDNREKFWIKEYDSFKSGLNMTLGGDGTVGYKHSEETKNKIRIAKSGVNNHNYGKKFSNEIKEKMSKSQLGEKNPNYGKKYSDEEKLKRRHVYTKKCIKIDVMCYKTKNKMNTFNSLSECAIELNISVSSITNVMKGRKKTVKGYYFIKSI